MNLHVYSGIARVAVFVGTLSVGASCATSPASTPSIPIPPPAMGTPQDATPAVDSGAFIVTLGADTIAAERYSRTGTQLTGESVVRSPQTLIRSYTANFGAGGEMTRLEYIVRRPNAAADTPPVQRATITFRGDSATVETRSGDSTRTRTISTTANVLPNVSVAYAPIELAIVRARARGTDSVSQRVLAPGGQASTVTVRRVRSDSVLLDTPFGLLRANVDESGRLLGLTGRGTTFQVDVKRVPKLDVAAIAAGWATRALGVLSPRDTSRATIGGANLMIDYGRPSKRGRTIFGNVVPWNTVWRTGSNTATHFMTDRDLVIGGTAIPAGTYTLWTIPSQTGWTLIVNKQTKQWGTEYKQDQDLARIAVKTEPLPRPLEQFTVMIEPSGGAEAAGGAERGSGVIKLAWDDRQAIVPFTVK